MGIFLASPLVEASRVRAVSLQIDAPPPDWRLGMWIGWNDSKDLYCLSHTVNETFLQIRDETELMYLQNFRPVYVDQQLDNSRIKVFLLNHSNAIPLRPVRAFYFELKCEDEGGFRPGLQLYDNLAICSNLASTADVFEQFNSNNEFVYQYLGAIDTTKCSERH